MAREIRLGMFIVGTLVLLAAGIFLIGDRQFLFSSTYRLQASFENVAGLNNGAPVRVGGIHKGTVRQIQLPTQSDGKMTVLMDMEGSTHNVIKKDSIAAIQTEGLLGNKYVEISFGSDDVPSVEDGDVIGSVPPLDISDLIKKSNEILDSTREATDHLESISSNIDEGKGTLGALVKDKQIFEQAKAGTTAFRENMEALKTNFFLRGFFNRRGYQDSTELTKHEIAHLPAQPSMQRFEYAASQIFDKTDSAKLKNQKVLNAAGKFLESNPFGLAVVVAYTGMKGDSDDNRVLTQARAMVVRDYLVKNFKMDDSRFKTKGLGKNARATGDDAGAVEILVYPPEAKISPVNASSPSSESRANARGARGAKDE